MRYNSLLMQFNWLQPSDRTVTELRAAVISNLSMVVTLLWVCKKVQTKLRNCENDYRWHAKSTANP